MPSLTHPVVPPIAKRMEALLRLVAVEIRPCRKCNALLAMVKHSNGKIAPYTMAGINHFIDCPNASDFQRKGRG